jgi:carbohydrate-selective porin OprB
LNGQAARLSNNQLSVREAWIRTELFERRLGVSVGRLDLTNYFDRNEVANDETSQFISDPLVNNPALGLSENGLGVAAVYDGGGSVNVKVGVQQSDSTATSLSSSLYKLAEIEYLTRPFSLPEGRYRVWFRADNSTGNERTGFGVSIDQKITPTTTLFARYGSGDVGGTRTYFYSGGLGFQAPFTFNPLDRWGIGYAQTEIRNGPNEKLAEAFYNLHLTEHLGFSALLQYVLESQTGEGYILPGMRMAVEF